MSDNLDPHTLRDAALVHLHATVKALVAENVYEADGELHCRSCLPSFTPGSDLHAPDCLILKLTQALGTYTPRAEAPPETPHMLRTEAREGHS